MLIPYLGPHLFTYYVFPMSVSSFFRMSKILLDSVLYFWRGDNVYRVKTQLWLRLESLPRAASILEHRKNSKNYILVSFKSVLQIIILRFFILARTSNVFLTRPAFLFVWLETVKSILQNWKSDFENETEKWDFCQHWFSQIKKVQNVKWAGVLA